MEEDKHLPEKEPGATSSDQQEMPTHQISAPDPAMTEAADNATSSTAANMEVHHHPQLEHKPKPWREYLLEYIMIVLAVTTGFFAESLRENISDNHKENEYMQSLLNDVRTDLVKIQNTINDNKNKSRGLDSFMRMSVQDPSSTSNGLLLYHYAAYVRFYSLFKSNDATMLQLKNSGGLRYIRKDHVADSIGAYDYALKIIAAAETLYLTASDEAVKTSHDVLDFSVYYDTAFYKNNRFTGKPIPLLTKDNERLKKFYNAIDFEKGATDNYVRNMQLRLPLIQSLVVFLKKEYNLE